MHRLSSLPGADTDGPMAYVEQPSAAVMFLTSASSDISALAKVLDDASDDRWVDAIRALPLDALIHPAQIDHYLSECTQVTQLIVVRLLGGRGHWSYGLEQCRLWQQAAPNRQLLVLSGTNDQERDLHPLGSVSLRLAHSMAALLREGGAENLRSWLLGVEWILSSLSAASTAAEGSATDSSATDGPDLQVIASPDPDPFDWRSEPGARVGVLFYRAHRQSADVQWCEALLSTLRQRGLAPRALWVSSLRDAAVQEAVQRLYQQQTVEVVITATSFASVQFSEAGFGAPLWDQLDRPVLQMLSSGRPRDRWINSFQGLDPVDLSLQVVLPELDGRVTTRIGAFREVDHADPHLCTAVKRLEPDSDGLAWIADHVSSWCELRSTPVQERRLGLVLANYPLRNGRLANGVGLDTPASCLNILRWLKSAGFDLGQHSLPESSDALMASVLAGRTNDPESDHRPPLTHLPLRDYMAWWNALPEAARAPIQTRWGDPESAEDLEREGFAIHGVTFGHVVVLVQPSRGYDPDQLSDLHSPDLPPPHRYLAQYLWLRQKHRCQLMVHVGKHGSAEWLPGKSIGLSSACAPALALGTIPNVYPFIVNDPGEGSQAKRRGQAVIIDHLTPPLGRAGLHGDLLSLESLLDEYIEARQLGATRCERLEVQLVELLEQLRWPSLAKQRSEPGQQPDIPLLLEQVETYLCELKEAQIRTGLHRLGEPAEPSKLAELLLAIARSPAPDRPGLTQWMATCLGLRCDPWCDEDGARLEPEDSHILQRCGCESPRRLSDAVEWIEAQATELLLVLTQDMNSANGADSTSLLPCFRKQLESSPLPDPLQFIKTDLWPRLTACAQRERDALLAAAHGQRVPAGPSGAPTRGRDDVLPTGRNFYSVDLRGLPTEAAWDLGRRSAEQLVELYELEEGEPLRHLALSVWGTATMRNGGEDIAQMFALLGIRPVWDGPTRRLVDLEVIPVSLLGRPRVDVTLRMSGLFRDAFPQLLGWVNRALEMVAALDETTQDNPLAALTRASGPQSRLFGSAPGSYGAGLQALIDSGQWERRDDLGEAYVAWSAWRYDGTATAHRDRDGLESALKSVQVVLHNQDNREHDLLDSDDYYQFQGGLSAAVSKVSGKTPSLMFADHSRRERLRIHALDREIDKVVRSRLLNPRWIEGMKQHGYKGAFEMGASLDYLFAYDATTGVVPDWCYEQIAERWLLDADVRAFLLNCNPWVLRDMAERCLEASTRQLWSDADPSQLDAIRTVLLDSERAVEAGGLNG
ncbi:cobaltochelatase/ CobN subunit [Synechococcus sp. A18-25c]|uniref:cobaltochelatase subunit CobN n=1 Tax=Synechococcus sp. A18-25c TaxID=1866938 RepID=UPI001646DB25|nr:cobaltochelatase subunit CobN [Synechococcus sp. A18-25c]QNJ20040.1 cobaltochelatase/ CobN subunit [Synechococcus sp. A18-25c]